MTHAKHTTIVSVSSDDDHLYILSVIGENPNANPYPHKLPKLALCIRAFEYDLDPEDPLALDLVLRTHYYSDTGNPPIEQNGIHPLFLLPTVAEAAAFVEDRIEEVRADRLAPEVETGARMLAGAVETKVATKALVSVRSQLLKATDRRLAEPVAYYRDQIRDELKDQFKLDPAEQLLERYRQDRTTPPAPINLGKLKV